MSTSSLKPIAILGAGSWGTALTLYLTRRGQNVRVWSIEVSEITAMRAEKANNRYLPGHQLPDTTEPHTDLDKTLAGIDDILVVVPSVGFRQTLIALKPHIHKNTRIICASKGIDEATGQLLGEVVNQELPGHPFAVLSGPSFAREVAEGLPTAVVIASQNEKFLNELFERFDSPIFRIDKSDDVIGAEVGGVVKNVIAIATGLSDGLGFGANTRSAIITRGLAEITRLGVALGAKPETFMGLAGLGDLILTCSDNQSRNKRLGLGLGKGLSVHESEKEIGQIVEGRRNAELVIALAQKHHVDMPVCATVWQVLQGKLEPKKAVLKLISG